MGVSSFAGSNPALSVSSAAVWAAGTAQISTKAPTSSTRSGGILK
jgi:hypothetical protein